MLSFAIPNYWGPVYEAAKIDYPTLKPNTEFKRDMVNVLVGLIWHTALTAAPIFFVIKHWKEFAIAATLVAITSLFLKYNWYDKMRDYPEDILQDENKEKTAPIYFPDPD